VLRFLSDAVAGFTGIKAAAPSDWDDRWYQPYYGGLPSGGVAITSETIFLSGVVLAAVRFRADIFSQSQPSVIRRNGQLREEVPDHYAQKVLRAPCLWMTGVRWRHLQMIRAQLGNSYNRIIPGADAVVAELRPIDTELMSIKGQRPDGSLVYSYRPAPPEPEQLLGQEEVLHFRGFSVDGKQGLAMSNLLRNAVGIALLAEKHTSTTLRKGARIAGLLIPEGPEGGKEKRQDLANSVNETFSAHENTGQMGVLPWGVKFQALSMDNQKTQLLELRDFQVGDILRFLGVPGVVVNWGEKTSTYASADAFFEEARRCVLPWVVNFEAEEMAQLLPPGGDLVIKHNLDAVLRADTLKRYEALQKATGRPWMTGNEARAVEDKDPILDDSSMDAVAPPPNQSGTEPSPQEKANAGPKPVPARKPKAPPPSDEEDAAAVGRLRQSALQAWTTLAGLVVRREVAAIGLAAPLPRYQDAAAWREWVTQFYERHADHVERALHLEPMDARVYTNQRRDALLAAGEPRAAAVTWAIDAEEAVIDLALAAMGDAW
jgi:HK97 family phage portal protein